jgi:acyl-CoA oxidase
VTRSDERATVDPVDPAALRTFLDGRWGWIRDEVRAVLQRPELAPRYDLTLDEYRDRVLDQARMLASTPGPRLLFPTSVGGGAEIGAAITAFETQALGDLSLLVKTGVQWGLFGGAILHLGTERHHRAYLPRVMSLDLPGCFAMTETGHGSDVQSLRTTATYDPADECFVLHTPDDDAVKDYIGNAGRHGRVAVVFAQLVTRDECHGVHAFLVPIRDDEGNPLPGVALEDCGHKAGLNGVDNGRISFASVRVERDSLLDRYGAVAADGTYSSPIESASKRFFTMLGTLVQGRVSISGAGLSASKSALAIAIRYGVARRQFHAPDSEREVRILDFRQHQRRLLPLLATTYAMHFAQEELIARLHDVFSAEAPEELDRRKLETLAAGIKAASTWHATRTIQTCREACGGAGYLAVNRLPQLRADTDVFTTFEGDNTVLMQLVAKTLLTDYQTEFGELDSIGVVRFIADQVVETVIERTSARTIAQRLVDAMPGRDEERSLFDRDWQLAMLAWRERHILEGLAGRMRKAMSEGAEPFDVFNAVQDHVVRAALAHVDRVVAEQFAEAVERCPDGDSQALLSQLFDLYALSTIETDRGWFLEHGRLTAGRSKAIITAVNERCEQLRPHAEHLVAAFGIPDAVLAAPIALGDEERRQRAKASPADPQP